MTPTPHMRGRIAGLIGLVALGCLPSVGMAVDTSDAPGPIKIPDEIAALGSGLMTDAVQACKAQVAAKERQEVTGEADRLTRYLAMSCRAILTDLTTGTDLDAASIRAGAYYLTALVDFDAAISDLRETRIERGARMIDPTRTGQFLIAREIGVMTHFAAWYRAAEARDTGAQTASEASK